MAKDIRWKWLQERGINVEKDEYQKAYMKDLWDSKVQAVFNDSEAGTGKTTLAVLAAAYDIELPDSKYDKIIYCRNALAVRSQGYLPGSQDEKEAPFMKPLKKSLDLVQEGQFEKWSTITPQNKTRKVFAITTSYERGETYENAYFIIDEAQNFTVEEMQLMLTRATESCKIIVIGSTVQNDDRRQLVKGRTGFEWYMEHYANDTDRVKFHRLVNCYRGWFAQKADKIFETINGVKR